MNNKNIFNFDRTLKKNYTLKLTKTFIESIEKQYKIKNISYLEMLSILNIKIPHLCYHNQLSVSGNCRLCIGIIGNDKKPSPLCLSSVRLDTSLDYNSPKLNKLREDVLEFILLNHPLDCPSCDQGGECDLQDYSYNFGNDRSRSFFYIKKTILNKNRGDLVKAVMNRCINCTRCIRFFDEIAGNPILGVMGRGRNSEISSYINKNFENSELSGNVIDLCPVGALISKNNIFKKRNWNFKLINSLDILDSVCSFITILVDGYKVIRVMPRINNKLNENWITDRIRFIVDSLYKQRIKNPLYKSQYSLFFNKIKWNEIRYLLNKNLENKKINIGFYFGELLNNESIFNFNKFMNVIGNSNKYSIDDSLFLNNDLNNNYLFNFKINKIDNNIDVCILLGLNIKKELPLLNLKLRKNYLNNNLLILNIGTKINLISIPCYNLCFKFNNIIKFLEGKTNNCRFLLKKKNPALFLNINIFKNENIYNFFFYLKKKLTYILNDKDILFNYISSNIDLINKYYINIKSKYKDNIKNLNFLYLTNVDNNFKNIIYNKNINFKDIFVIYQGHHINKYLNYSNLVLPSKLYLEEKGSYINLEGNVLKIKEILYNYNKNIKDNILIVHYIFSILFKNLKKKFECIMQNSNLNILKYNPNLIKDNNIIKNNLIINYNNIKLKNSLIKNYILNTDSYNFYLNNNINLSSKLMISSNKNLIIKTNYIKTC